MKSQNIKNAHICGHSFGGFVTLNFAAIYPDIKNDAALSKAVTSEKDKMKALFEGAQ